jgi:hypothetical protein
VDSTITHKLALESLREIPVVTKEVAYDKSNEICRICWSGDVTDQLKKAHADLVAATEYAACAIAFLLVQEFAQLTAVEQAARGTSVDYYLAPFGDRDPMLIFNHTARLEVTGILCETEGNSVARRVRDKKNRLDPEGDLPTFITVVEFSQPWSQMVEI